MKTEISGSETLKASKIIQATNRKSGRKSYWLRGKGFGHCDKEGATKLSEAEALYLAASFRRNRAAMATHSCEIVSF